MDSVRCQHYRRVKDSLGKHGAITEITSGVEKMAGSNCMTGQRLSLALSALRSIADKVRKREIRLEL